jgi:hypothetical protein
VRSGPGERTSVGSDVNEAEEAAEVDDEFAPVVLEFGAVVLVVVDGAVVLVFDDDDGVVVVDDDDDEGSLETEDAGVVVEEEEVLLFGVVWGAEAKRSTACNVA